MANMEGMATAKRERSPLKYPAAANLGLSPSLSSYTHSGVQSNHTADTNINTTFAAQASLSSFQEPSFAQDLGQAQQPFGITSDPAYDAFQSSAQHFTLDSTYPAGLNSTESTFSNSSILDPHISPHSLSNGASPDPISFPSYELNPDGIDPSLMNEILQEQGNPMATMGSSATPPHLLPGMMRNSVSPSPQASPNVQQSPFGAMSRPRNTSESLDPSSAFGHGSEWGHMGNFRGHRRGNSDALSEISSHSAQASPYMGTLDHSSPMLNPAADASFNDSLNIEGFTINDHPSSRPQSYHSPAHSPQPSPRLMPQQPLPPFTAENNYGLNDASIQPQFTQSNGYDLFNPEPFPTLPQGLSPSSNEMGQADHMSPPAINIDYAEPTRQIDAPTPGANGDLIIPPRRTRAKSDPYADHRPTSPGFRGRSPSLQPGFIPDNLSPFPSQPASRSTSPRGRNGSINGHVRSVSAASDQREYILDLANPERSPSNGGDSKRSQKHPATFQCHLCPKRFTRAYNLRSHLRTHTDERPFVCTVCKKAFARQHDRKRHEGLHSGEKKFVCRGPLKSGGQWGCSRRFARADALGRHFRSEAGRVCIKPLLDEEAAEQEQAWRFEQQQAQVAYPMFPQALLAQYPALAGIDWNSTPANPQEEEYHNGRSSFDASSGGEMYDEASENEMGNPYQNQNIGMMAPAMNQGFGMGMQQQTQMHGYGNHQMADFTNGMEGR